MKKYVKPFLVNVILSSLFGLINSLYQGNFLYTFCISFLIQFILYYITSNVVLGIFREKTKQLELSKLENLSTILDCAYCSQKNIMTFIPDQNEKSQFICESCNKENTVIIQFTVARTTETLPINSLLVNENKGI